MKRVIASLVFVLLMAGCMATPTATLIPTATLATIPSPTSSATPAPVPTFLPTPATTQQPTAQPSIAAAVSTTQFTRWRSDQVISAFKAAGIQTQDARPMTPPDYGLGPMLASEGTRFFIASLGPNSGGRVLAFAKQEDLDKTRSYYVDMGKGSVDLFSWVFVRDNIIVQINGLLPEDEARMYLQALMAMK